MSTPPDSPHPASATTTPGESRSHSLPISPHASAPVAIHAGGRTPTNAPPASPPDFPASRTPSASASKWPGQASGGATSSAIAPTELVPWIVHVGSHAWKAVLVRPGVTATLQLLASVSAGHAPTAAQICDPSASAQGQQPEVSEGQPPLSMLLPLLHLLEGVAGGTTGELRHQLSACSLFAPPSPCVQSKLRCCILEQFVPPSASTWAGCACSAFSCWIVHPVCVLVPPCKQTDLTTPIFLFVTDRLHLYNHHSCAPCRGAAGHPGSRHSHTRTHAHARTHTCAHTHTHTHTHVCAHTHAHTVAPLAEELLGTLAAASGAGSPIDQRIRSIRDATKQRQKEVAAKRRQAMLAGLSPVKLADGGGSAAGQPPGSPWSPSPSPPGKQMSGGLAQSTDGPHGMHIYKVPYVRHMSPYAGNA